MKEDIFDNIIKEKLDNLPTAPKTDGAWSAFESSAIFSQSKAEEDAAFDQKIKDSLQQIKPTFQNHHWQLLKSQLKTIEERKNSVFISKILEFAAIFLIVFTFFNWSGWMDSNKQPIDPLLYANTESVSTNSHSSTSEILPATTASNKEVITTTSIGKSKTKNAQVPVSNVIDNIYGSTLAHEDHVLELVADVPTEQPIFPSDLSINPSAIILDLQKIELGEVADISREVLKKSEPVDVEGIRNINVGKLYSEYALSFPMKKSDIIAKPEYSISVFGSGDINLINTPFDKLYSRASYNKEALNRSYGINLSKKVDQFELESGVAYAKREYQPDHFREAFGQKENYYSEVSLNKISYDIVSLPINFKYHFINQSNWGAYIMAGAALNLVMNANYDVSEIKILGRPAPDRYIPEAPRLETKPFINGLLSGDSFKDTYFASIGFGFGIQKKIFENTSVYVQPSYHRQILSADIGIGPNKDKIHTSSLQFGIKTVL